jgi:Plasmid recombination enzyme
MCTQYTFFALRDASLKKYSLRPCGAGAASPFIRTPHTTMPYAIIRIAKLKKSNIGGSGSHVARDRATPNADRSKLSANQTLIHNADRHLPMSEVVAAKIAASQQKRKIRPDAVHAVEILLTASPEYFRPDDPTAYGGYDGDCSMVRT